MALLQMYSQLVSGIRASLRIAAKAQPGGELLQFDTLRTALVWSPPARRTPDRRVTATLLVRYPGVTLAGSGTRAAGRAARLVQRSSE